MQKNNFFIAAIALFVGVIVGGVNGVFDTIYMAVGVTLFLVSYRKNKRAWTNLPKGASYERPLFGTIILVAVSVVAVYCSTARGFFAEIALGFGATALIVGGYITYKHFKSKKGSK